MPCQSDYLNASRLEVELSRALLLLDEATTGTHVNPESSEWAGYDKRAYNRAAVPSLDDVTALLCRKLEGRKSLVGSSLELQLWWRDHQRADARREAIEKRNTEDASLRAEAIKKLTADERRALGLGENQ